MKERCFLGVPLTNCSFSSILALLIVLSRLNVELNLLPSMEMREINFQGRQVQCLFYLVDEAGREVGRHTTKKWTNH
jgi:hypothetical protein